MSDTLIGGDAPAGTPPPAPAAPAGTPPPAGGSPTSLLNERGEFTEGWTSRLPEDLRDAPALKNFKSLEGMAKSLLSAQRMVGADKVVLPNEHTTNEEKQEFYNRLGRPETPDGYAFKTIKPEDMPPGMQVNQEFEKAFGNKAFELGLTKEQANELRDWHQGVVVASYQDADQIMEREHQKSVETLRGEWGQAFQANVDLANKVVKKFDPGLKLVEMGLGNNPTLIKLLAEVGKTMSEDRLVLGEADRTPGNAKAQINAIMGDPKSPYFNPDHAQHKDVVAKVAELYAQMHHP